jgi:hypothetical protein
MLNESRLIFLNHELISGIVSIGALDEREVGSVNIFKTLGGVFTAKVRPASAISAH